MAEMDAPHKVQTSLYQLGYLNKLPAPDDAGLPRFRRNTERALARYLFEAGLGPGAEWESELIRLGSFSQSLDGSSGGALEMLLERVPSGVPHLLQRVIRLRLFTFGLAPVQEGSDPARPTIMAGTTIARALERFVAGAKELELLPHNTRYEDIGRRFVEDGVVVNKARLLELLGLLSSLEEVVTGIGRLPASRFAQLTPGEPEQVILVCAAKVRLFALGYAVWPDGITALHVPRIHLPVLVRPEQRLYYALYDFWHEAGAPEARERARRLDRHLIVALAEASNRLLVADLLREPSPANLWRAVMVGGRSGVLQSLPAERAEVITTSWLGSRVRTVQMRLYLLGYLRWLPVVGGNEQFEIDPRVAEGIRRFQTDAGLTVDGWVGDETWQALEELVSFEAPANIGHWVDRRFRPLLLRAVRLRLFALGFIEPERHESDEPLRRELPLRPSLVTDRTVQRALMDDFRPLVERLWTTQAGTLAEAPLHGAGEVVRPAAATAMVFGPTAEPELPQPSISLLALLFDMDRLTALVAGLRLEPYELLTTVAERLFLVSLARTNLWLLGYSGLSPGAPTDTTDLSSWREQLLSFRREMGLAKPPGAAGEPVRFVDRAFFAALPTGERQADRASSEQLADALLADEMAQPSMWERVWGAIKSMGSRLWDGLRRAWRFIVAKGKALVAWLKGKLAALDPFALLNVGRLLYNRAVRAFAPFQRVAHNLAAAARFAWEHMRPPANVSQVDHILLLGMDLDATLYIGSDAMFAEWRGAVRDMGRHAAWFSAGMAMFGAVLRVLARLPAALTMPGLGWMGLIVALWRAYRDLQRLARQLPPQLPAESLSGA